LSPKYSLMSCSFSMIENRSSLFLFFSEKVFSTQLKEWNLLVTLLSILSVLLEPEVTFMWKRKRSSISWIERWTLRWMLRWTFSQTFGNKTLLIRMFIASCLVQASVFMFHSWKQAQLELLKGLTLGCDHRLIIILVYTNHLHHSYIMQKLLKD
jgi:hypothetical protein